MTNRKAIGFPHGAAASRRSSLSGSIKTEFPDRAALSPVPKDEPQVHQRKLRGSLGLGYSSDKRRGRIIGSAAVLKTAVRKDMQVRVLSPPPSFSTTYTIP